MGKIFLQFYKAAHLGSEVKWLSLKITTADYNRTVTELIQLRIWTEFTERKMQMANKTLNLNFIKIGEINI